MCSQQSYFAIWQLGQQTLGLKTHLKHKIFKQKGLTQLQKQPGWCYRQDADGLNCTPWRFDHMKISGSEVLLETTAFSQTEQLQQLQPLNYSFSNWQLLIAALQHYWSLEQHANLQASWLFCPCYILHSANEVIMLAAELQSFLLAHQPQDFREQWVLPYNHPYWKNKAAVSYSLAVLNYQRCSGILPIQGSEEEINRKVLRKEFIPLTLQQPTTDPAAAQLTDQTLQARKIDQLPTVNQWQLVNPEQQRQLEEAEINQLAKTALRYQKNFANKARFRALKSFWISLAIALPILTFFLYTPIRRIAAPPATLGLPPREIVQSYYERGFNHIDYSWLNSIVRKANQTVKKDLAMIEQLFISSRVRMAYESVQPIVPAAQWQQGDYQKSPGRFPFGVIQLTIAALPQPNNSFIAKYTLLRPGPVEDNGDTTVIEEQVTDRINLVYYRESWLIESIDRSTVTIANGSSAAAGG